MHRVTLLLLVLSPSSIAAQSRVDLLQRVANHYNTVDTFDVKGTATARIPGTSWQVSYDFETEAAQPAFLPLSVRKPSMQVTSRTGARVQVTLAVPGATDPKPPTRFGAAPLGQFNAIALRLRDAQKIGTETITVDGHAYPCEIVAATYDYSPAFKPNSAIDRKRFWVDPAELIVLRETRSVSGFDWTGNVTSFSFDQPPSEALIEHLKRFASQPKDRPDWVGRTVPDLTLNQLSGRRLRLASLHGKPALLDFWASYCGPCRRTTIHAQELKRRYRSAHLVVLTFTQDTAADARLWTRYNHIKLPVLLDPKGAAFTAFGVQGVPVAILIGADGRIAHYWVGLQDPASMDSVVAQNLGIHPPSPAAPDSLH